MKRFINRIVAGSYRPAVLEGKVLGPKHPTIECERVYRCLAYQLQAFVLGALIQVIAAASVGFECARAALYQKSCVVEDLWRKLVRVGQRDRFSSFGGHRGLDRSRRMHAVIMGRCDTAQNVLFGGRHQPQCDVSPS